MGENPTGTVFDRSRPWEDEGGYDPLEFIEGEEEDDPELAGLVTDDGQLLPRPLGEAHARPKRPAVFTPEHAGSAEAAVIDLARTNAHRRPILLSILEWARDGIGADELFARIEQAETFNKSVYAPVSYCRMLERAGGLVLEGAPAPGGGAGEPRPAAAGDGAAQTAAASDGDGETVSYLVLDEVPEPIWRTTEAGAAAWERLTDGESWRECVLGQDRRYGEVYRAVMGAMAGDGAPREELCALAETFEVTREPRKMGSYFIDVLESVDAARWDGGLWALTPLGASLLPELEAELSPVGDGDGREEAVA